MRRVLGDVLATAVLLTVGFAAVGGAMGAVAGPFKPRGEFVDIGGRKLRLVCEGPAGPAPLIVMEAGAFGTAADFGAIQQKLAANSLRSCAYDRAGMGWSDPGPKPRDTLAITSDLEKLLAAKGEAGPFILMGHSMAGIHLRTFAARNPDKVAGIVMIEAAVPAAELGEFERRFLPAFTTIARVGAVAGSVGLTKPLSGRADRVGLPEAAAAEKRHAYGSGRHMRTAANEVINWRRSSQEAAALAPFDPKWPVAVIMAGGRDPASGRADPARHAVHGHIEVVDGSSHNSVLGLTHGDSAVRGVAFVLANLKAP